MKWINVKREKPKHDQSIMVTNQKAVWYGYYNSIHGGFELVYDGAPPFDSEEVTHWMQLPDPIKGYANTNN